MRDIIKVESNYTKDVVIIVITSNILCLILHSLVDLTIATAKTLIRLHKVLMDARWEQKEARRDSSLVSVPYEPHCLQSSWSPKRPPRVEVVRERPYSPPRHYSAGR
jgi:hypothetical protein